MLLLSKIPAQDHGFFLIYLPHLKKPNALFLKPYSSKGDHSWEEMDFAKADEG